PEVPQLRLDAFHLQPYGRPAGEDQRDIAARRLRLVELDCQKLQRLPLVSEIDPLALRLEDTFETQPGAPALEARRPTVGSSGGSPVETVRDSGKTVLGGPV